MNREIIEKAKEAKSVEELLAMAKAEGVELTEEQAKEYFARLNPASGEMSDDELNAVAGGGCGSDNKDPYIGKYVTYNKGDCSCCLTNYFRVMTKGSESTYYQLKCQRCGLTLWEHDTDFTVVS